MIDLYTWKTPNGRKASIALEEMGLDYEVHSVRIGEGDQHEPGFRAINPNGKIPAIVDRDLNGFSVFESGAILIYLAEKTGSFLPTETRARSEALQWLMFQMGGVGPMQGQAGHFANVAPDDSRDYGLKRYREESRRLYEVLDERLARTEFLARDYSIADMATYPWIAAREYAGVSLDGLHNLARWVETVGAREGVRRGMQVP